LEGLQPESDLFSFPKLRWTVCHIRELMPTKQVSRGISAPIPLEYAIQARRNVDDQANDGTPGQDSGSRRRANLDVSLMLRKIHALRRVTA